MKKIVLLTLVLALIISATVTGCVSPTSDDDTKPSDTDEFDDPIVPDEYSKGLAIEEYEDYCAVVGIGDCTDEHIYIPDTYNGKPVTEIISLCYEENYHIKSITIPNTVTNIGSYALWDCLALTEINLPTNLKKLDLSIFACSDKIEKIVLPNSLEVVTCDPPFNEFNKDKDYVNRYENGLYLGSKKNPYLVLIGIENSNDIKEFSVHKDTKIIADDMCYYDGGSSSIETINISNSVTYIGHWAFYDCTALKSINIPKSVEYIGSDVFQGCTALETISISATVKDVGAIRDLPNLKYNEYGNGLYLGDSSNPYAVMVGVKDKEITSLDIHGNTRVLAARSIYGLTHLESLDIPDSVRYINKEAICLCSSIQTVTLSNSLEELEYMSISWCDNITKIVIPSSVKKINTAVYKNTVRPGEPIRNYEVDVYYEGTLEEWLKIDFEGPCSSGIGDLYINNKLVTDVVIPNGVKCINDYVFDGFGNIKTVSIPGSVEEIGDYAFANCDSLEFVNIPASVSKIGNGAFASCDSLANIIIPGSVKSIGEGALSYCKSLTSVTIPDSVTSLGAGAFEYCTSLKNIKISNHVTAIGKSTFSNCTSLENVSIPDSVVSISPDAFDNCTSLKYTVENNVYYLGNDSNPYVYLVRCDDTTITKFTIPNQTKMVHPDAFENCEALVEINIPEFVSDIAYLNCFGYNDRPDKVKLWKLSEVHPDNQYYTMIDGSLYSKDGTILYMYLGVEGVESFAVPNTVTHIKFSAFYGNQTLKSVTMSDSVRKIDHSAFKYSILLESIELSKSLTRIDFYTFEYCFALKSISIPDSVTVIKGGAFAECRSLTNLELGASVNVISKYAFLGCTSLSEVVIPDSVKLIEGNAFANCYALKTLKIGKCDLQICASAFKDCKALETMEISADKEIICEQNAFTNCKISRIDFNGTKEEWSVVGKSLSNSKVIKTNFTVYCTDGTITKK